MHLISLLLVVCLLGPAAARACPAEAHTTMEGTFVRGAVGLEFRTPHTKGCNCGRAPAAVTCGDAGLEAFLGHPLRIFARASYNECGYLCPTRIESVTHVAPLDAPALEPARLVIGFEPPGPRTLALAACLAVAMWLRRHALPKPLVAHGASALAWISHEHGPLAAALLLAFALYLAATAFGTRPPAATHAARAVFCLYCGRSGAGLQLPGDILVRLPVEPDGEPKWEAAGRELARACSHREALAERVGGRWHFASREAFDAWTLWLPIQRSLTSRKLELALAIQATRHRGSSQSRSELAAMSDALRNAFLQDPFRGRGEDGAAALDRWWGRHL